MKIIDTAIADVKIIEPAVFGDDRGFFFESFNQQRFDEAIGRKIEFVQDNHSRSSKGVLRGLHYQMPPFAQGKLVRCTAGEIFDVVVDIRKSAPTFLQWIGVHLSAENKKQLWIPPGFAHGFLTLSETAEVQYKVDEYWHAESDRSIIWNDQKININWPLHIMPQLSKKDEKAQKVKDADLFS